MGSCRTASFFFPFRLFVFRLFFFLRCPFLSSVLMMRCLVMVVLRQTTTATTETTTTATTGRSRPASVFVISSDISTSESSRFLGSGEIALRNMFPVHCVHTVIGADGRRGEVVVRRTVVVVVVRIIKRRHNNRFSNSRNNNKAIDKPTNGWIYVASRPPYLGTRLV